MARTSGTDGQLLHRLDHSPFTRTHTRFYLTALAGHFFDGFTINLTGFVLPGVIAAFALTSGEAGVLSSALFAGMLVGAAMAGIVSDRLGRRYPLALSILIFGGFSLLAAAAWNYPVLVAARTVQGIGLGAEIAIVLPYIAEFVPTRRRGPLVTLATAAWLIGLPVASAVAIGIVPALGWRSMFFVGTIPVLIALLVALTLPESVRYLLRRGKREQATEIVELLTRGSVAPGSGQADPPAAHGNAAGSVRDLLRGRYSRYTIAIWVMEVCAGAFLYGLSTWLPTVLKSHGIGLLSSFAYTGIITAAGVAGAVVAGQLVNRLGRRWALAPAFLLSGLLCLLWGAVSGTSAVVLTGALATFFGSGVAGSTLFVYASELYPTANRATGLGWAAAWQKVGGLLMPVTVGFVLSWHASSYVFFLLFAVISAIAATAGLIATLETRGKSVEEIATEMSTPDSNAENLVRTTVELGNE
ncbi:MFS transporter [Amycolatopsis acidiphila]|uniref:MFS transporter n=1 Tax=Amycolatopsis acidiphila TaxID=715473 RepID=A0A558ALX5_9PSEU|nr:MFS transporter [Amycolatopsis acidiphila]TVT25263.1 MFS transporter [Amycolatopsis acidiphila]UIJ62379.1 MFS transporter [Amycolatopsis acidiphila]GHG83349.1 MFS transporter [Amycolatopsis acidiphila]